VSSLPGSNAESAVARREAELGPHGRGDWISVRITAPGGASAFVLERRDGASWTPVAMAPDFSRDELRALGAPTDLLRDAS